MATSPAGVTSERHDCQIVCEKTALIVLKLATEIERDRENLVVIVDEAPQGGDSLSGNQLWGSEFVALEDCLPPQNLCLNIDK